MSNEQELARKDKDTEALQTEAMESEAAYAPQVDIIEREHGIEILADMPGVAREDVSAMLEEGILTISGKVTPPGEAQMSADRREYDYGNFYRSFTVGEGLDTEGINACMKDGVLKVTVPKSEKYRPKQIEIK